MTKKLHDFEMLTYKERFQAKEKHLRHIASSGLEMCFGLTHVTEKADETKRFFYHFDFETLKNKQILDWNSWKP